MLKNKFYSLLQIVLFLFVTLSCQSENKDLKIVDTILNDTSNYFYTDLDSYKTKNEKLPIGIFDSGTGGLTVFDAIVNFDQYNNNDHSVTITGDNVRDFNNECFIYLADQANMPYGNYGANNKTDLLKEHIIKDAQFLLNDKYYERGNSPSYSTNKAPIKALVIACNTATAFGLDDIEQLIDKAGIDLKVIGVIGAGVRASLSNFDNNENGIIAVMATAGTVASNGYKNEIFSQLKSKNYKGSVEVFQQGGVGIAGAIDNALEFIDKNATAPRKNYKGPSDSNTSLTINLSKLNRYNFDWTDNKMLYDGDLNSPANVQINSVNNYISFHVTTLLEQMLESGSKNELKSVILGCTHYPFYTDQFASKFDQLRDYKENGEYIYRHLLADKIEFIDPAIFTAKELYEYLAEEKIFNNGKIEESEFYISVPNLDNPNIITEDFNNFTYDYKYGRNVNEIQEYVKRVPFNRSVIPDEVIERLSSKIPYTFKLIRDFNTENSKTSFLSEEEKIK